MKTKKNQLGPATFQTKAQRHTALPLNALTAKDMAISSTIAQWSAHAIIVSRSMHILCPLHSLISRTGGYLGHDKEDCTRRDGYCYKCTLYNKTLFTAWLT